MNPDVVVRRFVNLPSRVVMETGREIEGKIYTEHVPASSNYSNRHPGLVIEPSDF